MSRRSQAKRAARAKDRARQRARQAATGRVGPPRPGSFGAPPGQRHGAATGAFGEPLGGGPYDDPYDDLDDGWPDSLHDDPGDDWFDGWFDAPYEDATFRAAPTDHGASRIDSLADDQLVHTVFDRVINKSSTATSAAAMFARLPRDVVISESARRLLQTLRNVYAAGWQPAELARHGRIRLDSTAAGLVGWLIAADRVVRPVERMDERWRAQLDDLALPTPGAHRWLDQWATRRQPLDAFATLADVIGELARLPRLEVLIPPPGIEAAGRVMGVSGDAMADPVLQKVRALLAKAESTQHEAEAALFTAKAQELMTKHAIDLAMLEGERRDPSSPSVIRLPVDPPYADAKALLLQVVAEESRCRTLLLSQVLMSTVIGYPADLEAVDLLFTSLLVQAQHALTEAIAGAPPGSRQRSQGFKSAFLVGFAQRIKARLAEVNRLAYTDERRETFLPVLRSREEQIADFMDTEFGATTHSNVRGAYDPEGYHRGTLAGDAARLTAGAVEDAGAPPPSPSPRAVGGQSSLPL